MSLSTLHGQNPTLGLSDSARFSGSSNVICVDIALMRDCSFDRDKERGSTVQLRLIIERRQSHSYHLHIFMVRALFPNQDSVGDDRYRGLTFLSLEKCSAKDISQIH